VLDEIVRGPTSQFIVPGFEADVRELSQRFRSESWQYKVAQAINAAAIRVKPTVETTPKRVSGFQWAKEFATLRNASRGHGAVQTGTKAALAPSLADALLTYLENSAIFARAWVYLHKNLSGKYRVTSLNLAVPADSFEHLKKTTSANLVNGVYLDIAGPRYVHLADSDVDASDFYVANGGYDGKHFEMISYGSGHVKPSPAAPYNRIHSELPRSETTGGQDLYVHPSGHALTNMPALPEGYVPRPSLEESLWQALTDGPSPIVTLFGRGGIGKTSLALATLHKLQKERVFDTIIWFSARDIDLRQEGPKPVRPDVQDHADLAAELTRLLEPAEAKNPDFNPMDFFASSLRSPDFSGATLYVFDNFETVRDQAALFRWIYEQLRAPNKALITTRHREFNGDFTVEVTGMTFDESIELIKRTGSLLHVEGFLNDELVRRIYREADGHPYVMKILVGEIAKSGPHGTFQRVFARREDILQALFERTFTRLSAVAKRAFLVLCDWKSPVPEIALEAVLLRSAETRVDVQGGIEELHQSSFVELVASEADDTMFVRVPLSARLFGERKLSVDPNQAAVRVDRTLLEEFGAIRDSDFRYGFQPRVDRFLHYVAQQAEDSGQFSNYMEILEFIGQRYPAACKGIAELLLEAGGKDNLIGAKRFILRYLEEADIDNDKRRSAWKFYYQIAKLENDIDDQAHALVQMARIPDTWLPTLSNGVHFINGVLANGNANHVRDKRAFEILARELATLMEARLADASATDGSRLAWLWLHLGEQERAKNLVERLLRLEPDNYHCIKLAGRLGIRTPK
jgi:tetratricopeptide (TPR) repeat protein